MRTIRITVIWLAILTVVTTLVSCNPMSSVDYKIHNMTEDTITVTMYKEIFISDYHGYAIEENDSVISRYGENDSINVAILKPHQALWVHNDWDGLYREERVIPLWRYIRSIKIGDTERAPETWANEQAWHLKTDGGKRFEGESRYYNLYIRGL